MIEREEREKKILEILRNSETLVSGTYLAEFFDVSRQIIVQDIAILKAKNIDIISTNRGYRLLSKGIKKIFLYLLIYILMNKNKILGGYSFENSYYWLQWYR